MRAEKQRSLTIVLLALTATAIVLSPSVASADVPRVTAPPESFFENVRERDRDVAREFYKKHLGLKVVRDGGERNCFLTCGKNFVALFGSDEARMDHYCYAVRDYSVESAAEKLRAQGLVPRTQGNRIYFDDPDGLEVQLSAARHTP